MPVWLNTVCKLVRALEYSSEYEPHISFPAPKSPNLCRAVQYQLLDGAGDGCTADTGLGSGDGKRSSRVVVGWIRCAPGGRSTALGDNGDVLKGKSTKVPVNIVPK